MNVQAGTNVLRGTREYIMNVYLSLNAKTNKNVNTKINVNMKINVSMKINMNKKINVSTRINVNNKINVNKSSTNEVKKALKALPSPASYRDLWLNALKIQLLSER